mgnify:CR=1 FL=1
MQLQQFYNLSLDIALHLLVDLFYTKPKITHIAPLMLSTKATL